jgi:hypothetical protein
MDKISPYTACKRLEARLQSKFSSLDLPSLPHGDQRTLQSLRQVVIDARLTLQEYEMAETRQEQQLASKEASAFLQQATKDILMASSQGHFSAVDVAHLSATIEQIIEAIH